MSKPASITTLLVVALVALGLMAFVSLSDGSTGNAVKSVKLPPMPKPGMGPGGFPKPVIIDKDVTIYEDDDYDEIVYSEPKLTKYDCTLAREIRKIDDRLSIVSSDALIDTVNTCNAYGI